MNQLLNKNDIYKEVYVVLSHFNVELIQKIPQKVFSKLVEFAADSQHDVFIDVNKSIEEQNICEESKDIISLIYYTYVADDSEKKELINIWTNKDKE